MVFVSAALHIFGCAVAFDVVVAGKAVPVATVVETAILGVVCIVGSVGSDVSVSVSSAFISTVAGVLAVSGAGGGTLTAGFVIFGGIMRPQLLRIESISPGLSSKPGHLCS